VHLVDETYDPERIEQLKDMLRALAQRIALLDGEGRLLDETPSLLEQLGNVRSELFRYEVRVTYDTPEIAEHRRIVDDASSPWAPEEPESGEPDEEDGWPRES
jgi:hypothetical protein